MKKYVKKYIIIILFITVVLSLGCFFLFPTPDVSYSSPKGNYHLDCYTSMSLIAMPGGGGRDSRVVLVILRDKYGREIGRCEKDHPCAILFGSLEIEWEIEKNIVWFSRGRTMNLVTGKLGC